MDRSFELRQELIEQSDDLQDLSPIDLPPRAAYLPVDSHDADADVCDEDADADDVDPLPSFRFSSEHERSPSVLASFHNNFGLLHRSSQVAIIGSKYAPVESLDYE
jgi:hypothetical protein